MRYFQREQMTVPELLKSPLAEQRRREMTDFIAYASEVSQQRRAPLDRAFLQSPEISHPLLNAFKSACAYCETLITSFPGPCQHRPAGMAANDRGETDFLHYVWLAYEWDNLYLACDVCTKHKENRFPVRNGRGPVGAPIAALREIEDEMLVDPCFHNPSQHLEFRVEGIVTARSDLGKETIQTFALNRSQLVESRRKSYIAISRLIESGVDLAVAPTGLSYGPGAQVLDEEGLPHAGATSLMLMGLAKRNRAPAEHLTTFLSHLRSASPKDRAYILRDLDPAYEKRIARRRPVRPPTKTAATRKPAKAKREHARCFRIDEQPLATVPITSIRIQEFKALKAIEFKLPVSVEDSALVPCMLILGENAAGKSTVLEAIALALLGTQEIAALDSLLIDDEVTPRDLIRRPDPRNWRKVADGPVEVEIGFLSWDKPVKITGGNKGKAFSGSAETAKVLLAYGPRRYFASRKSRRLRAPARRVRSLFDPMATIANPLDWLLHCPPAAFDVAARALKEILMLGDEAEFRRAHGNLAVVTAVESLPLAEMSVGYKSVIAMATDIMRELMYHYDNMEFAHAVVLIDEIETHLHPRWKMRIVSLLRRAFPKVQFIITTHDPLCLRGVFDGEVFVLRRNEAKEIESVDSLPSIRGMRAEQLLTSEFFGLGSTDPETDAKMMRYHNLVVQGDESGEAERLRGELESTMKIGDTLPEQLVAEALRKADINPFAPLAKVATRSRQDMVEDLLGSISELRASQSARLGE